MREDGFEKLLKKVKRFFAEKKNVSLTREELETIVQALERSNNAVLSLYPDRTNEFQDLVNYISQYQDSALLEKKKQKIKKYLTPKGFKCHLTRKCFNW